MSMMTRSPCIDANKKLEEMAEQAERRKCEAIDKLNRKVGPADGFERALHDLIDADRRTMQEKGR